MKGKRGLATKITSKKKKKQRTIDNPASAVVPTPNIPTIVVGLVQTIQIPFLN
jgi:hypothetical protein